MKKNEIELLNNELVALETLEGIELSEDVEAVEICGNSSQHVGATWHDVQFKDGTSIDVFVK